MKGVHKDAPLVDESGLVLSQNYDVDVYYDLGKDHKEVLCLVYDKISKLTYATSMNNTMIRIYTTPERAKISECESWGDGLSLEISGMTDTEYITLLIDSIKRLVASQTSNREGYFGTQSEDFTSFDKPELMG